MRRNKSTPRPVPIDWLRIRDFAVKYKAARQLKRVPAPETVQRWCKLSLEPAGLAMFEEDSSFGTGKRWRIDPRAVNEFIPDGPGPKVMP